MAQHQTSGKGYLSLALLARIILSSLVLGMINAAQWQNLSSLSSSLG